VNKRWLVNRTNQEFLEYLSRKTSISTVLAQILVNRGFKDAESIKDFLSPSLDNLHDPFLMPDMDKAVRRIETALENNESVLVFGDYDADGLTSAAILVTALRILGLNTTYHIPNRITEGYGLNKTSIRKTQDLRSRLIVTADCGISSEEEISLASSLGIDVIVTDHHEPPEKLPDAAAVINPRRVDSSYPFNLLAGVGVAYKFVQALFIDPKIHSKRLSSETPDKTDHAHFEDFLQLVALGTVADSVPLIGENRILVTYGLRALNNNPSKPWIHALKEVCGTGNKALHSTLLSYTLIPRINAVGRLGDPNRVVDFFLTEDTAKAKETASFIEKQNKERQKIEEDVFQSALLMLGSSHLDHAIVLSSPAWHQGVIGIVASRLVERFYRPVFLFSEKDTFAKGSARSIPPFHIYSGLTQCNNLLLAYGGHSQAAGLSINTENLSAFRRQINTIVETKLGLDDLSPVVKIDAGVELFEITFNLIRELNLLEPFGNANTRPVLGTKGIEVIDPRTVGNNHLKAKSKQKSIVIDTIGFSMSDSLKVIENALTVDIAFTPCINEWNGTKSLQLNLKALRPSII
jgi:single-stranded-DNA-specific exonuclease